MPSLQKSVKYVPAAYDNGVQIAPMICKQLCFVCNANCRFKKYHKFAFYIWYLYHSINEHIQSNELKIIWCATISMLVHSYPITGRLCCSAHYYETGTDVHIRSRATITVYVSFLVTYKSFLCSPVALASFYCVVCVVL